MDFNESACVGYSAWVNRLGFLAWENCIFVFVCIESYATKMISNTGAF